MELTLFLRSRPPWTSCGGRRLAGRNAKNAIMGMADACQACGPGPETSLRCAYGKMSRLLSHAAWHHRLGYERHRRPPLYFNPYFSSKALCEVLFGSALNEYCSEQEGLSR